MIVTGGGGGGDGFSKELQAALMRLFDENSKLRRDLARITEDLPHLVSQLNARGDKKKRYHLGNNNNKYDTEGGGSNKQQEEEGGGGGGGGGVPAAEFEELLAERDRLQADLRDALQRADEGATEAVIRQWVDAKVGG